MSNGQRTTIFNNRMLNGAKDLLYSITANIGIVADAECIGVRELLLKVKKKVIF